MPNDSFRRIGLVCGAGYISGKEMMALELASGLKEIGWNINVATTRWGNGELSRRLHAFDIPDQRMWLGYISATPRFNEIKMTLDQLVHVPSLYSAYGKFLRENAPGTVIHTNWHHLLLLLPFLKPDRDIFWVHEVMPNKTQYRKLFAFFSRRLMRFVAVSDAVRRSIIALDISPSLVTRIHNGVSPFSVARRVDGENEIRIGVVGQIGAWKGHEDLIKAFAGAVGEHPDCELHIFGAESGSFAVYLRSLVTELKLNDKITWHGFVSDRAEIYDQIDICVVPSRFEEPFGLVAVEAAMAGLPCVATKRGGLPEIVQDQITGLLVEPENPDELARALKRLVEDPDARRRMGEAARQVAHEKFSRERLVTEFADLLEK